KPSCHSIDAGATRPIGSDEFLRSVNFQVRDLSRRALVSSPAIRLCQDLKAMYCMPFRLLVRVVLAPSEMWKVARGICVNCLGSFGALQGPADSRDSGCRSKRGWRWAVAGFNVAALVLRLEDAPFATRRCAECTGVLSLDSHLTLYVSCL